MKKQLIAAAVAASMSAVATADVSITGAAQVNYTYKDYGSTGTDSNTITHDFDLKITGKSGNTTIVLDIENKDTTRDHTASVPNTIGTATTTDVTVANTGLTATFLNSTGITAGSTGSIGDPELNVKNAYMTTSIAGVNVKMGTFTGGEALLANASPSENKVSLDTTIGGIKLQYENNPNSSQSNSVTVSGGMNGVNVSYEKFETKDDVIVDLAYGPVKAQYRNIDLDGYTNDQTSIQVDAEIQGMTITYADIDAKGTSKVSTDGFFGEYTSATVTEADGFGVKTSLAGNTVNVKSYEVTNDGTKEDHMKIIVTRALESGATLEATYHDMDNGTATESFEALDLELRIAF
jgi:hypothetical protein